MKKTILSIFLSILMVSGPVLPAYADADLPVLKEKQDISDIEQHSYVTEGDYQVTVHKNGTVTIVNYIGSDTEVVIPEKILGKTVTTIGKCAFFNKTRITDISIPETVTKIEDGAFLNCVSLESFVMPDSVIMIGAYIFGRDRSLKTVKLSEALTTIPLQTFYNCQSLENITIPENVTCIEDAAFAYCKNLGEICLPDNLQTVGEGIFYSAIIESLHIPLKTIPPHLFSYASFSEVIFSGELERVEEYAFSDADIVDYNFPKTLSYIDPLAFASASYSTLTVDSENPYYYSEDNILYSKDKSVLIKYPATVPAEMNVIRIPDSVTTISDYALSQIWREEKIEDSEEAENSTYSESFSLKVEIPSSVTSIGKHAFEYAFITDISIPETVEIIPESFLKGAAAITSLEIREGTTQILAGAFSDLINLESVRLPATLAYIDPTAFAGCENLKEVIIDEENPYLKSDAGFIYNKEGDTLLICCNQTGSRTIVIPEQTKKIGEKAFAMQSMSSIVIPDSVTTIGAKAFYNCQNLHSLKVPVSVTSIGEEAIGYEYTGIYGAKSLAEDFRIIAEQGSAAAVYAAENGVGWYTDEFDDLSGAIIEMKTGETIRLDQTGIITGNVQYTSGDEQIAYCDVQGNVKAFNAGETSIVMSCGTDYVVYNIQVTGEPVSDGHIPVDIETGKEYQFDPSVYDVLDTEEEFDLYLKEFIEFNKDCSFDPLDNECIVCYSGDEYVPLLASRGDPIRIDQVRDDPCYRNTEMFDAIADELYNELSEYKTNRDVVFYRGIKNAAEVTGTGSSIADMKNSIGQIFVPDTNMSTSLSHQMAYYYSGRTGGAVLEIYAPKEMVNGCCISGLSRFPTEYEYLMNEGARLLILDAGVRIVTFQGSPGGPDTSQIQERYFKLLLLKNDIMKVQINLPEPDPGCPLAAEAEVHATGLVSDMAEVCWMKDGEPVTNEAEYGTKYRSAITLTPDENYAFTDQSSVYINGEPYEYMQKDDGSVVVFFDYETPEVACG